MKNPILIIFVFTLINNFQAEAKAENVATTSTAESASNPPRFGISSSISNRSRYQENSDGDVTHKRVQYKFNIDAFVNLTEDGCLKANSQIATGSKNSTYWDESGIGDADGEINLNVRRLYIDFKCYSKRLTVQAGALGVHSPGELGIKGDAWADGVRASIVLDENRKTIIVLTAADVDQYNVPSVFDRDFDGVNYKQVNLSSNITKNIRVMADFTEHDKNTYARALLELALTDIVGFVDSFALENLLQNEEQRGFRFESGKKLGKWDVRVGHSNFKKSHAFKDTLDMPIEDFFGEGSNNQIFITRSLSERTVMKMRFRDGDAGKRFEIRFDYKLK